MHGAIRSIPKLLAGILLLLLSTIPAAPQNLSAGDFTLVLFPDTQNEAQFYPQVLNSETQWVVDNRSAWNIQAVLGLGDIVNDGADPAQQQNADAAIRILDNAQVPYLLSIGNHDYDGANTGAASRTATGFNQWFGPSRYAGKPYYNSANTYPAGSNENFYAVLNINGKNYLFLVLEYVPRNAALDWAKSVVQANGDKEIIVVTHSNMFYDGTRVDVCDTNDLERDNDGDETWAKFTSLYPNISMVVSGHITTGLASRRADLGVNGNLINQIYSNYQVLANGGDGWMRLMTFHTASNTIDVKTYSPYLNQYKTDAANQFTVYWHNPGPLGSTGTVSGRVTATDCTKLSGITMTAGGVSATTDANGHYTLAGLPPANYQVTASGNGYATTTNAAIVNGGYTTDLNFYLTAVSGGGGTCTLNPTNQTVTICSPANSATVASPVQIVAGTTDSNPVTLIQIYVDGVSKYTAASNQVNTSLAMTAGAHRVTVQAKDSAGVIFKSTVNITVSSGGGTTGSDTVTITSPANGATVASPVTVSASASGPNAVQTSQVYVDGALQYSTSGGTVNTSIAMADGAHSIKVQDQDSTGATFSSTVNITVGTTGGGGTGTDTVTITSPANNATVPSPVQITATASGPSGVKLSQIYVDGALKYTVSGGSVNTSLAMADGAHRVTVQAQDNNGVYFKTTVNITVSSTATGGTGGTTGGTGGTTGGTGGTTGSDTVTINSPGNNATVSSPVAISASASGPTAVKMSQIYVDGAVKYTVSGGTVNTSLAMTAGAHRVTVQDQDVNGVYFKSTVNITVQ